jgi:aminoglycoside/choline kinase family phosphotransferase
MQGFSVDRMQQLQDWLAQVLQNQPYKLTTASADASFRRYFRVIFEQAVMGQHSVIVMDAPPEKEDVLPFIKVAQLFQAAAVPVPQLLAQDVQQGFLLLSDFGDTTLLSALKPLQEMPTQQETSKIIDLYLQAIDVLINIQLASQPQVLPAYDQTLLMRELRLFDDWYIAKHLNIQLTEQQQQWLDNSYQTLLNNILAQPNGYVHRDYHSRNLMLKADGSLGVLDFQDAVYGPLSYDLVSLLKDAYIHWDEELVLDLAIRYWQRGRQRGLQLPADFADFYRDFEWMGAQRHIKILGIFARLNYRDGKQAYLKDLPLVMDYLRKTCERYIELAPMLKLLNQLEGTQPAVGYTF